jgi:hypothetical protein
MWRGTPNERSARFSGGARRRSSCLAGGLATVILLLSTAFPAGAAPVEPREEAEPPSAQPVGMQNLRFFHSMRRLEKERADAQILFTRFQANGLIDSQASLEDVRGGNDALLKPIASRDLSADLKEALAPAFALAFDRLRAHADCRSLFHQLKADGPLMLATTIYMPDPEKSGRACRRKGVAAFTTLGNPTTYLCPSFADLPLRFAALSLIHEALHYAGLPERPSTHTAMSSEEINEVVHSRCDL